MKSSANGAPLAGRRLLVTRPDDVTGLATLLRGAGAEVVSVPATHIVVQSVSVAMARATLPAADWVVLTSRRAVELVLDAMLVHAADCRFACVGQATADALAALGRTADLVADPPDQAGLLACLDRAGPLTGQHLLFPAAVGARTTLEEGLRARGAVVQRIDCYESIASHAAAPALRAALAPPGIDLVIHTAPSTVTAWVHAVGATAARAVPAASIGARTSATLVAHGIVVATEAAVSSAEGLVAAIVAWSQLSPLRPVV